MNQAINQNTNTSRVNQMHIYTMKSEEQAYTLPLHSDITQC